MAYIVEAKTPLDAQPTLAGWAVAPLDKNDLIVFDMIVNLTTHATVRAHAGDYFTRRLAHVENAHPCVIHQGIGLQCARWTNLDTLAAGDTAGLAHGVVKVKHDFGQMAALSQPDDDGTTHVVLSPLEFTGRLVALVPKPRVNLTRFHGVFSPNSKLSKKVVPAERVQDQPSGKPGGYDLGTTTLP